MNNSKHFRIGVVGVQGQSPCLSLSFLEPFQPWFSVQFEVREEDNYDGLDGVIFAYDNLSDRVRSLSSHGHADLHIFASMPADRKQVACLSPARVRISQSPASPSVLRGREFLIRVAADLVGIEPGPDEMVVASADGRPLWVVSRSPGRSCHRVGIPFPILSPNEHFFDYFNEERFIRVLPLIQFLRDVTTDDDWSAPLRAAMMFDDPNLHWLRYGCIDYEALVASGKKFNYHTTIATVPIDGWFVHNQTAKVFRDNDTCLSLLVHGNSHIRDELAAVSREDLCVSYLSQALRRVKSIERRSGVQVSRVMAAPHGACNEDMMRAMVRLGFEAACISTGSLRKYNYNKPWVRNLGFMMSEMIAGLPVIPRFRLSSECRARILIAAYLRQPIIPVGHHLDLIEGLELLQDTAEFINSFGDVQWMDMQSMARSNFLSRRDGQRLYLRVYSRCVNVNIPKGVHEVHVSKAWHSDEVAEQIQIWSEGCLLSCQQAVDSASAAVAQKSNICIIIKHSKPIDPDFVPPISFRPWPILRRQLAECRDRLYPLQRIFRKNRQGRDKEKGGRKVQETRIRQTFWVDRLKASHEKVLIKGHNQKISTLVYKPRVD